MLHRQPSQPAPADRPIAVVGIGCRLPGGVDSPGSYWNLLAGGVDAVSEVPDDRWDNDAYYRPGDSVPGRTNSRWGGFVQNIDHFDPESFGISAREAVAMDPQQRMLLEVTHRAIEDAGMPADRLAGSDTAVFTGISSIDYAVAAIAHGDPEVPTPYSNTGGSHSIAANRLSHRFDLRGPSVAVDTACSSSLVAVHLACEAIRRGESTAAIAAGVNALLLPDFYIAFSQLGVLSPDGRCKTFDAAANGYVRGEGAGAVLLKPLDAAVRDGDRVYCVIAGSALNQDGRTPGLTVPSGTQQRRLIREACRRAGVDPTDLTYVEAHGTGTAVGDPIEATAIGAALARSLDESVSRTRPCHIGSVKTNLGHLEAGAGIASLIKVALSVYHGQIPPHLNLQTPNPAIDFDRMRLAVPRELTAWEGDRWAGINGFGYGGANAHVILCGIGLRPVTDATAAIDRLEAYPTLLPVSAPDAASLRRATAAWADWLDQTDHDAATIAAAAAHRRTRHDVRVAVVGRTPRQWAEQLRGLPADPPPAVTDRRVAMLCCGQGPQHAMMATGLYAARPVFAETLDRIDATFARWVDWSLVEELHRADPSSRLQQTRIAQPAIFAVQVAQAALWKSMGVTPSILVGHSVGEIAAAYLAGGLSFEDACRVAIFRGQTMDLATSRGAMIAVGLSEVECRRRIAELGSISGAVAIAAVNGPASTTISGDAAAVEKLAAGIEADDVFCRRLAVEYAFHSPQMEPVRGGLLKALAGIVTHPVHTPMISTVTGRPVSASTSLGADYWWQNVRQSVRYGDAVARLARMGLQAAIELGPHPVLSFATTEGFEHAGKRVHVVASGRRTDEADRTIHDDAIFQTAAASLFGVGIDLDWDQIAPRVGTHIDLPPHPLAPRPLWYEAPSSRRGRLSGDDHPLLGRGDGNASPTFTGRIDPRRHADLSDHRVRQSPLLPAAAAIETAMAAVRNVGSTTAKQTGQPSSDQIRLSRTQLHGALALPADSPLQIQTHFDPATGRIEIAAGPVPAVDTIGGDVLPKQLRRIATSHRRSPWSQPPRGTTVDLQAVQKRCTETFDRDGCYDYADLMGLNYGAAFQGVTGGCRRDGESLVEVHLHAQRIESATAFDARRYGIHPAVLDSCFHAMVVCEPKFPGGFDGLYLPHEIDEIQLPASLPVGIGVDSPIRVHAEVYFRDNHRLLANVHLYDEQGGLIGWLRGFESRRVGGESRGTAELIYRYRWVESGIGLRPVMGADDRPEAYPTTTITGRRPMPHLPNGPVTFVHRLRPRNVDSPGDLRDSIDESVRVPLAFVQAHAASGRTGDRLFLVTTGGSVDDDTDEPVDVAAGPLIGLGRVIVSETGGLRTRLVDLDPGDPDPDATLATELAIDDGEDEIRYRGGRRWVHRFGPDTDRMLPPAVVAAGGAAPYRLAVSAASGVDDLTHQSFRRRSLRRGEVEIEVAGAGLNFSDVMKALGLYPGLPPGPVSLGAEVSGVITRVGPGVNDWSPGMAVIAIAPGGFASHVAVDQSLVAPAPRDIDLVDAAAIPVAYLTADHAIDTCGRMRDGETLLVHSASGGVGLAAIEIARDLNVDVVATAGSDSKREFLRDLGVKHVFDSRSLDFVRQIRELLDRGELTSLDAVLNSLPGEAIPAAMSLLSVGGRFLEIGKRDIYNDAALGLYPMRNNLSLSAIDLDQLFKTHAVGMGRRLRELVTRIDDDRYDVHPPARFDAGDAHKAFAFMRAAEHIGKVVVDYTSVPTSIRSRTDDELTLRHDGTYWLAGGLGGFGLHVAGALADAGAGCLVLGGRSSTLSDEAARAVERMRGRGTRVEIWPCDITDAAAVADLIGKIDAELPPLRGVLHTAMVLKDRMIADLYTETLDEVLWPKVLGGWNLHAATAGRELDFFVLFSSLTSVFGHAGQANYSAANAALDSLAHHRRHLGLPATVINWGHVGQVGYLAKRQELSERLRRQGVLDFSADEAVSCLARALHRRATQCSVLRIDWTRWRGLGISSGTVSPRFAHLIRGGEDETAGASLLVADPVARAAKLAEAVTGKLADLLGVEPSSVDPKVPMLQLGLDSLMAVELRNWIESKLLLKSAIGDLMRSATVAALVQSLAATAAAKLADGQTGAVAETVAEDVEIGTRSRFAMSDQQAGVWYTFRRRPQSTAYNVFLPIRMRAALDIDAFAEAFECVVDRHASLRTTFDDGDGRLMQIVHDTLPPEFNVIDLRNVPADQKDESALRQRIAVRTQVPFDLTAGPLMRVDIYRLADDDCVVLATTHHIVVDFWSLILISREMRVDYQTLLGGGRPDLTPPPRDYYDYVADQRRRLASTDGRQLRDFWTGALADVPAVIEVTPDGPRPASLSGDAGAVGIDCPRATGAVIAELAERLQVTESAVVLAAAQVLIGRYVGHEKFLVGTPTAGRTRSDLEDVVGFFVGMLPVVADLGGDPTFEQLIGRAADGLIDTMQHEAYPLSQLIRDVDPPRDASRSPLLQVSCTFESSQDRSEAGRAGYLFPPAAGEIEPEGTGPLAESPFYIPHQTCHYDLEFIFEQNGDSLRGMLVHSADLYSRETATAIAGNFVAMLSALVAAPDRPISTIAMPGGVVVEGNQRRENRQDFRRSQAIAIAPDTGRGEFDRLVNRIAGRLIDRGMTASDHVPVVAAAGTQALAMIRGVMRGGGVVVPIDANQSSVSPDRLIADTGCKLALVDHRDRWSGSTIERLSFDELTKNLAAGPDPSLPPIASGDAPAYVIYTSGSTGVPKGVRVSHRAINAMIDWRLRLTPLSTDDRMLIPLSHGFDAGLGMMLLAHAGGAAIVWPAAPIADCDAMIRRIIDQRVTVLVGVPSWIEHLAGHPDFDQCRDLRHVWVGGESMPADLPRRIAAATGAEVWNVYGPTEAAVEVAAARVDKFGDNHRPIRRLPVGHPADRVWLAVVDAAGRPLPPTVAGELVIGGDQLADGYVGDPELTAKKFVQLDERRVYRTGDAARLTTAGEVEILGRIDRQIKVGGYRVEPGEIESVLVDHAAVTAAAVVAAAEGNAMIAHIETNAANVDASLIASIRRHAALRLPPFKRPAGIVPHGRLPRGASGKIDLQRLPKTVPDWARLGSVPPRTLLETYLVDVWADVLGGGRPGVGENFFDAGGSSLQAAMVTHRISESLGVPVPASLLFDLSDIVGIARYLTTHHRGEMRQRFGADSVSVYQEEEATPQSLVVPLQPDGDAVPIVMIHPPGGIISCYRDLAGALPPGQPLLAVRSRGLHGAGRDDLPPTLSAMAAEYVRELQVARPGGPYIVGGWSIGGLVAAEVASQLLAAGETVERLILIDTAIPPGVSDLVDEIDTSDAGAEYGIELTLDQLVELNSDEQLPILWQHAQRLGLLEPGTDPAVAAAAIDQIKGLFHHHLDVARKHRLTPIDVPVLFIRPAEVPVVVGGSPDRGWSRLVREVEVVTTSGHHHSMVQMPHAASLAGAITGSLVG